MSYNSLSYSPLTLLPNVLITHSVTKLLNCFQIKNVISVNLALITAINKTMQSRRYEDNPRDAAVFEASGPQGHFLKKKVKKTKGS